MGNWKFNYVCVIVSINNVLCFVSIKAYPVHYTQNYDVIQKKCYTRVKIILGVVNFEIKLKSLSL